MLPVPRSAARISAHFRCRGGHHAGWYAKAREPATTLHLQCWQAKGLHAHACRVHAFQFQEPYYAITERFERFDGVIMEEHTNSVNKIALFHYVLKCVPPRLQVPAASSTLSFTAPRVNIVVSCHQ